MCQFSIFLAFFLSLFLGWLANLHFKIELLIFFLLIFVFVSFLLSRVIKSASAMLFLIFFFPLLPVHLGYDFGLSIPVLRVHRVLILFMLLFWLFKSKTIPESFKRFPITGFIVVLLLFMSISSFFCAYPVYSFFYIGTMFFEFFLFSLMCYDLIKSEEQVRIIFRIVVLAATIAALVGIIEYITKVNIYSFIKPFRQGMEYALNPQMREGALRIKAAFDHSISFGMFLVLSLNAICYLLWKEKLKIMKNCLMLSLLVIVSAILLTKSRIAIFLLFFNFSLMLFLFRNKIIAISLGVSLFITIFILNSMGGGSSSFILLMKGSFLPFSQGNKEMLGSAQARIKLYFSLMDLIKKNPIFGYGKINLISMPLDNFYLSFAYSFGIICLGIFLLMMLKVIIVGIKSYLSRQYNGEKLLIGCMLIGLLSYMIALTVVALPSYWFIVLLYLAVFSRFSFNKFKPAVGK